MLSDDDAPRPPSVADALHLDGALKLLDQSGHRLPERSDAGWLQAVIDALCDLSSRDALTQLANRRQFEIELVREIARVSRAQEAALVLMVDIDHFKMVNDTHGHAAGDQVIKAVAGALVECVRPMDVVGRLGGEEFAVILPNCGPAFGDTVAERIRAHVEALAVPVGNGTLVSVTISIGGAFVPQQRRLSAALWLDRADRQLYQAKSQGRNRACIEAQQTLQLSADERRQLIDLSRPEAAAADFAAAEKGVESGGPADDGKSEGQGEGKSPRPMNGAEACAPALKLKGAGPVGPEGDDKD